MNDAIAIEIDFPSASAGEIRQVEPGRFEISHLHEEFPDWFQETLDRLFGGGGVPKEYMFHVRVRNNSDTAQTASLRFLFSPRGCGYLALPWWLRRDGQWEWLAGDEVEMHEVDNCYHYLDATVSLAAQELISIGSAPYESPGDVDQMTRATAAAWPDWSVRELGTTAQGRPILALESAPRPIKLLASATMQGCEPTWMGLLHAAHAWAIPTAEMTRLREQVQLCVVPLSNPDGLAAGHSVTNAVGEVPKFSTHLAHAGAPAPLETQAMWDYLDVLRPHARIEMHAHFTRPGFTRSIGMQEVESLPGALRDTGNAVEQALDAQYHQPGSDNRRVRIDPRIPEHDVYGVRETAAKFGLVEVFLQAVAETIEGHNADVLTCIRTVAGALVDASVTRGR